MIDELCSAAPYQTVDAPEFVQLESILQFAKIRSPESFDGIHEFPHVLNHVALRGGGFGRINTITVDARLIHPETEARIPRIDTVLLILSGSQIRPRVGVLQ